MASCDWSEVLYQLDRALVLVETARDDCLRAVRPSRSPLPEAFDTECFWKADDVLDAIIRWRDYARSQLRRAP